MCGGSSKISAKTTIHGRRPKNTHTTYTLKVSLEELYSGTKRYLQIKDRRKCLLCKYTSMIHGSVASINCKRCLGSGIQTRNRLITVNIRKGLIHGDKIIFKGAAMLEAGFETGKLIIILDEQEHPVFKRHGNNLYVFKPLKCKEKESGFHTIETIDGRTFSVTNTGDDPRRDIVLGEGIPVYGRKPKGALFIKYMNI